MPPWSIQQNQILTTKYCKTMSQITERENIIQIAEVAPIPEIHAAMVYLSAMSNYKPVHAVMPEIDAILPENILAAINASLGGLNVVPTTTCVSSPNILRGQFKKTYASISKKMTQKGLSTLDATKASVIATISRMNFKVEDGKNVGKILNELANTQDGNSVKREVKALMNQLKASHTKVFTSTLARACAKASLAVGFKEVEVKEVLGKLEVIATNMIGQRLISEISMDQKTSAVNVNTETIGITDGSCSLIMNRFNDELKRTGIKIGNEEMKFTGGACQMSYAKMIDQQDKEQKRKEKEVERLRKLNTIQKQRMRS